VRRLIVAGATAGAALSVVACGSSACEVPRESLSEARLVREEVGPEPTQNTVASLNRNHELEVG
jgi:hypothetical protein